MITDAHVTRAEDRRPQPSAFPLPAVPAVVEVSGVRKTYREGQISVAALRRVDLAVLKRSFTMIVGPSGSGKTTLLNLIGALDMPDEGSVSIDGQPLAKMSDRALTEFRARKIGFIFQNFNLVPVLTAAENVEFGLLHSGLDAAQRREAVAETLAAVGLRQQAGQRPNQLSGGQRQRVAIARALVKQPSIVLADEPTANLDSTTGGKIVELMQDMQKRFDTTFIFSTHDPELMRVADVTHHLRDGVLAVRPQNESAS
jgi:putative ABC transport system ATP-binding protein